jgi:IS30 family transposase
MTTTYTHLSRNERDRIYQMWFQGKSIRAIARVLRRAPSTISRELRRNCRNGLPLWDSAYDLAKFCHEKAKKRRSKKRVVGILSSTWSKAITPEIRTFITECVEQRRYSAEDISIKLLRERGIKLSGRSIRRWVKAHARHLIQSFPRKGKPYRSSLLRKAPKDRNKRSIHQRSEEANSRLRLGHFEADCVVSSHNTWSLLVVEDRASSRSFIKKVPNLQSETVRKALFEILLSIPEPLRRTCTFDNGSEFACYKSVEKLLQLNTYFCDAYKSWQKGGVENKNSRIRRYFPKGTDFEPISEVRIQQVETYLNDRPVKRLGHFSANEFWGKQRQELLH